MAEQEWWTTPLQDDDDHLIMVTGRGDVDKYRRNKRYAIRIEVTIPYQAEPDGMPTDDESEVLDKVLTLLKDEFDKDPIAVLTGVYTGAGERNMIFYAGSTNIFNKKLNQALAPMPLLPLEIKAYNDPDWEEYDEMRELSEIQ